MKAKCIFTNVTKFDISYKTGEQIYVSVQHNLVSIVNSFSVAVFRSGKIPESLYTAYEQQCKKMADDILEGASLHVSCLLAFIVRQQLMNRHCVCQL